MAVQPWSTVALQWTVEGLSPFIDRKAARQLIGAASDDDLTVRVTQHIARMARFYRQKLIDRCQREFPDTLDAMRTAYLGRVQEAREFQNWQSTVSGADEPIGDTSLGNRQYGAWPPGSSLSVATSGVYGYAQGVRPAFYLINSQTQPINSSLLAGIAQPGDNIGDISPAAVTTVYVNHGTLAVPQWDVWDSSTLVDYILNPSELLDAGYIRTTFYMKGFGTVLDDGSWDERIKSMPSVAGISLKEALEQEALAFNLINFDRSANGLVSDADKVASKNVGWFF